MIFALIYKITFFFLIKRIPPFEKMKLIKNIYFESTRIRMSDEELIYAVKNWFYIVNTQQQRNQK